MKRLFKIITSPFRFVGSLLVPTKSLETGNWRYYQKSFSKMTGGKRGKR